MTKSIVVADTAVPIVEIDGARVVTLAMVDKVHGRPDGTARRNFNENRDRLIEGEDYRQLSSDEIRTNNPEAIPAASRRGDIVVLSETGYLMLTKSLSDDLAWQVQRSLVKSYFRASSSPAVPAIPADYPSALRALADAAEHAQAGFAARDEVIAELKPHRDALERIAGTRGTYTLTIAAKLLQMKRIDLIEALIARNWLYRDAKEQLVGRSEKEQYGFLTHKRADGWSRTGKEWHDARVRITGKGLARIALLLSKRIDAIEAARISDQEAA